MFHKKLYLRLYLNEITWKADVKDNSLMYFYVSQYINLNQFKLSLNYYLVNNTLKRHRDYKNVVLEVKKIYFNFF